MVMAESVERTFRSKIWTKGTASRIVAVRRASEVAVATAFGLEPKALKIATRGPARAAFARQTAMYLAHVGCGLSLTEVGRAFGRDRTTVAHACGVVEDRRDEAEFDRMLTHLENAVTALIEALAPGREA